MSIFDGTNTFKSTQGISADHLDKTVVWHGTTLPTNPTNEVPANGLFLKTDDMILYENTGTEAAPVWTEVLGAGSQTPIIQTVDVAGFDFDDMGELDFEGGIKIGKMYKEWVYYGEQDDWTLTDEINNGSKSLPDGIDQGIRVASGGVNLDSSNINKNDIRRFDPANCVIYGIFRRNEASQISMAGISANQDTTTEGVVIEEDTNDTFIRLQAFVGSAATTQDTDVAISTNSIPFLIICTATNQTLFLLVAGKWTSKAVQSTRLPTAACQPIVRTKSRANGTHTTDLIFMLLRNSSL